ncbi:unnamed protein product [Spodoptera littoralis]|uniref:Uncharacterized protein n=1 Tax=Spodoptera littoralis TaxID=7109 RepID=A0A9P0I726_SPOLI|nr:unnamed protein product [Spodoptera littoralis]CAH1642278.1 unnamed protein product [Spodoptera littoralis]
MSNLFTRDLKTPKSYLTGNSLWQGIPFLSGSYEPFKPRSATFFL